MKKSWRCQKNYHFWIWTSQSTCAFCTGALAFFIWTFFDTASKKNLEVAHSVWKDFWIWPTLSFFLTPPPSKKVGGGVSNPEISLFFWRRRHHFFGGGGVRRNRLYWSMDAWIHTSSASHLHRLQVEIVYIDALNKTYGFPQPLANGHITLNTPVLVRSLKLSSVEPSQYLDGWPPGNTGCCWQSFLWFFLIYVIFFGGGVEILTQLEYPTFLSTYVKHGRSLFLTTPPKKNTCMWYLLYFTPPASKKYMCTLVYATWYFIASMKNMCTLIYAS